MFCCTSTFSSNSHYRSLYHGPTDASYSLAGVSCDSPGILKRFYALLLPICTFSHCLVHAIPPQSPKIGHLPSDASAILRERYLAGTFSVVTQYHQATSWRSNSFDLHAWCLPHWMSLGTDVTCLERRDANEHLHQLWLNATHIDHIALWICHIRYHFIWYSNYKSMG